jgi:hypothetical protein
MKSTFSATLRPIGTLRITGVFYTAAAAPYAAAANY